MKRSVLILLCMVGFIATHAQIGVFQKVISDSVFSKDYRFRNLPNYSLYNGITNIISPTTGTYDLTTPPGNTATRPTVPSGKYILRYNTDSSALEIGNPSQVWRTLAQSSVSTFDTSSISNFGLKVRSLLSASAPLLYNGVTGNLSIPVATSTVSGYLSQADWVIFNAKLPDPGSNGLVARTALGTTAARQLIAASTNISLVNANGVSGNPSIDINDTLLLRQLQLPYIPAALGSADSALFLNRSTNLLEVRAVNPAGTGTFNKAGGGISYSGDSLYLNQAFTRNLFSAASPITYNSSTGVFGADTAILVTQYDLTLISTATLNNIGSGFRAAATPSGNIKTFFGNNTIVIDSSSNSNALTFKVDTSQIATQFDLTLVNNGVSRRGDTTQLGAINTSGSPLNHDTWINTAGFTLTAQGSFATGDVFIANNTGAGSGLRGSAIDSYGVSGTSNNLYGVYGTSTISHAIQGWTTNGNTAGYLENTASSTNTVTPTLQVKRTTSGTAAAGIGSSIEYYVEKDNGANNTPSHTLRSILTSPANGAEVGQFEIYGVNNAVLARKMAITGAGQQIWDGYPALTAQNDTTTYKPVAIDGSGNVVKMSGWAGSGGGGGATLNNIGSGYRIAATSSGNVKSLFFDATGTIDSSSNSNALTFKVDTSLIGTKTDLLQKSVITKLEGTLYSGSSGAFNLSDFTSRGATASIASGGITFSGGANNLVQTLDLDTTMRERYFAHIEQKVGTINSTSDGNAIGIRSVNPAYAPGFALILVTNNTGNGGKILLLDASDGSVKASSTSAITFAAGDTVAYEYNREVFQLSVKAWNKNRNTAPIYLSYTWDVSTNAFVVPNTGTFSIFHLGGTNIITDYRVISKEAKNAPLICLGDSKTIGYYSSNSGRYPSLLNNLFWPTLTHAGPADKIDELNETFDEVASLTPVNAVISIGSNDIGSGLSVSQVFTKYKSYVARVEGIGTKIYHLLPFYQPTIVAQLDSLSDSIRAYYPAARIIDCRTPMRNCSPCYLNADSVHLNLAGDSLVYSLIMSSGLLKDYYKPAYNLTQATIAGTPTLHTVLTAGNTSGVAMNLTGYNMTDSKLKIGSLEVQPYALNNGWIGENSYFDNTNWRYRATGYAERFHLQNGHIFFETAASGSAGAIITWKLDALGDPLGNVGIGSAMNPNSPLYSDANLYIPAATGYVHVKTMDSTGSVPNVVYRDPVTKALKLGAYPSGGATTIYNGDGTLAGARLVSTGGNTLTVSGANNSDTVMVINNTGTTGLGLHVSGTALGINVVSSVGTGLQVFGSTRGAIITGDTDEGLLVKSNAVRGARIQTVPSSTNTVVEVLQLERGSSGGSGATGIGEYISFLNKTSTNSSDVSNTIVSKFTDGTTATRTSQFVITGVNNASSTNVLTLDGDGSVTTIGKRNIAVTTSAAGTLTLDNAEAYIFNGSTTTWTLPAVSGTTGRKYYIKNIGSGTITLNSNAGGNDIYSTTAVNTLAILTTASVTLISNGTYFTVID